MKSFRRATANDLKKIVELLTDDPLGRGRERPSDPLDPAYHRAFEAIDRDPNQHLAVVEVDGELVGTLQLTFLPGLSRGGAWRGQVEAVRVARSQRGQNLGAEMIAWAIDQCRARGCSLVQLTTDKARTRAHAFYEKLGFVASHEGMKLAL